jgi:UvrD/REP helicase N-terminal domain
MRLSPSDYLRLLAQYENSLRFDPLLDILRQGLAPRSFNMPWDDDIDPESPAFGIARASIQYVRVVAGPGTGKSFALKRRVARLLEEGIDPTTILPVTFTNVAAEDLQREMLNVGVLGCENIRGSTLHSLGMRILSAQHVLRVIGRVPTPQQIRDGAITV